MVEALACGTPVIAFPRGRRSRARDRRDDGLPGRRRACDGGRGRPAAADRCAGLPHLGEPALRRRSRRRRLRTNVPVSHAHGHAAGARAVSERTLSVLDGSTFVVGDRLGDVRADEGREHGFFSEDTRFISRWVLRVGDAPLELLSLHQSAHFDAQFFLTPRVGPDEQAPCSVVRHRLVDHVWMEEVTVTNHLHETSRLRVALEVDADFADLFEVKDGAVAPREVTCTHDSYELDAGLPTRRISPLGHDRQPAHRRPSPAPASSTTWSSHLVSSGRPPSRSRPVAAQPGIVFARREPRGAARGPAHRQESAELETWLAGAPALQADDPALLRTYRASLSDLGALRMHPDLARGRDAARGRPAVVHGAVRSRQPDHELPGAALPPGTRRNHPARPRRSPGHAPRRLPRAGAREDPARAALRRAHRARRTTPFAVLRKRRRHAPVPRAPGRVPPLDRRRRTRPRLGGQRPRGPGVDRGQRRPRRRWLRRVRMPQPDHRPGQPMLEGQLGLDPIRRRHARPRADRDLRDPGLRLRRATALSAPRPRGLGRRRARRAARAARRATFRRAFAATSGCPSAAVTPSRWTATNSRSTA